MRLQTDNDNISTISYAISYAISKRLKLELPDWMGGPTDRPTEKWLLKLRIRNLKMSRILATAMVVWSDVERLRESTTLVLEIFRVRINCLTISVVLAQRW